MQTETKERFLSVIYYVGGVLMVLAVCELIPLATSFFYRETRFVFVFLAAVSIMISFAAFFMLIGARYRNVYLSFGEGMTVASLAWLMGTMLCALPYYFSGNYLSYLDCCFDVMSGLTTTGLSMIQDLDHLSNGLNMWRFLLTYIGGQGMVVLALTFVTKNAGSVYMMYVGEGKDERLRPGAVSTARAIWKISILYLIIGWIAMSIAGIFAGLPLGNAVLHGLWIFMSGWSTGGFAPMSQNILYYHSLIYELATVVFFTIGSFNFALHYAVLSGNKKEMRKNIEIISFTVTLTLLSLITAFALMHNHVYPNMAALFRKGFYQLISGHTTTGFMSLYARQIYHDWEDLAIYAMILAMLFGGSACSTAGGFKGLRIGIIFNIIRAEIRQYTIPQSRVITTKIHHIRDIVLTDSMIRSAFSIVMLYLITFSIGTIIGMAAGYSGVESAFESASVTGNVGLSIGVTSPSNPAFLKITYILIMWLARLEFVSVLTLIAQICRRLVKR
ncbi:MAG: TrkH family potassium uptake protein [Butyrivibrio sp.]|nr:TrkH family potassium uptake protein [Butyrivibrio sp.]